MFSFNLATKMNRNFCSYAERTVFVQCIHYALQYLCVHTDMSYACICMCMCVCICVHINKILQTLRWDQIPSGCDSSILLQFWICLCKSTTSKNLAPHTACTVTANKWPYLRVWKFCNTEILLQKQQSSSKGTGVCYCISGGAHLVVQG